VSGETIPLVACAILYPQLVVPVALLTVFSAPAPSRSVQLLGGSQVLVSAAVTSFVLLALGAPVEDAQGMLTAAAVAGTVFWASSLVQVLAYERIVWQTPVTEFLPPAFGTLLATTVVAVPLVGLVGVAVESVGVIALPMTLVPIAVLQYFHGLYQRKVQLTDELADKAEILARTNLQFAAAMVRALDTRDAYTAGHSAAVAVYTRDIAREMGFDDETIRMAHLSGLLHDIGKIGVPGRVLNKTAPLDDEEYELMKSHAAMGADILGEVDLYADIAILVRYHHERIDGRGYPEGIGGEAIPAISRMISVADTYSAMTTDRPYRDGMPTEKAMSILRECRGTQLDSDFTDAFLRILIVADEAYQRGKQTDFEVEVAKHQAMSQVEAETVRLNDPHPHPAGPVEPDVPMLPAAVDGELVEVELEREAA
jgi:putative nucleotidyltransferase with HDIG domain